MTMFCRFVFLSTINCQQIYTINSIITQINKKQMFCKENIIANPIFWKRKKNVILRISIKNKQNIKKRIKLQNTY